MLVSPVVSTDAMEYHLMIPKIALATGKIAPLPSLVESNYPGLMSFIYLLIMPLAGDIACKAMHFLAGIAVLFAIARLVDRIAPKANRLLAPALYLTIPVAAVIFGWAWNDNFFVLCVLLALGQLLDFNSDPAQSGSVRHLLLAGILLGLAAWTKYTIVMILTALAPLLVVAMWKWRWRPLQVVTLVVPIGLISLLVFLKLFVLFHLFAWYVFRTETRSLLSLMAVVLVLASPEIERPLFSVVERRRAALLAVATVAMASLLVTGISSWVLTEPLRYFIGLEGRTAFLKREVVGFGALDWINTSDEVRGAVLVGFKRPYYAEKPIWFSAFSDIPIAEVLTGPEGTSADLARKLKILGATHIAVDRHEWDTDHEGKLSSWSDPRRKVFEDLLEEHCRPVAHFGATTIYRVEGLS